MQLKKSKKIMRRIAGSDGETGWGNTAEGQRWRRKTVEGDGGEEKKPNNVFSDIVVQESHVVTEREREKNSRSTLWLCDSTNSQSVLIRRVTLPVQVCLYSSVCRNNHAPHLKRVRRVFLDDTAAARPDPSCFQGCFIIDEPPGAEQGSGSRTRAQTHALLKRCLTQRLQLHAHTKTPTHLIAWRSCCVAAACHRGWASSSDSPLGRSRDLNASNCSLLYFRLRWLGLS